MAEQPRPRVFLDTNVIFSALHSSRGPPAEIVRLHIEGAIRMVVSQQVLEELVRTITTKLPDSTAHLRSLLLSAPPEVVRDPPAAAVERWAEVVHRTDAPVIAAAVEADVDYFLTGDEGLRRRALGIEKGGIRMFSPRQFLDERRSGGP